MKVECAGVWKRTMTLEVVVVCKVEAWVPCPNQPKKKELRKRFPAQLSRASSGSPRKVENVVKFPTVGKVSRHGNLPCHR